MPTLLRSAGLLLAVVVVSAAFAAEPTPPATIVLRGPALVAARASLAKADSPLAPSLTLLRAEADKLLELKPASVLDKSGVAASGDKHDYFSFAPYWWPDPAKPDGLPYIQRDGQTNPAARSGTDFAAIARTCNAVETLGLAYWFTGDERYAKKAATLTRTWFLDPATRMNPNLDHAQAIPGLNTGRGIGIIEARHLIGLNDGLALLAGSPAWTESEVKAMRAWLGDYYHWLTTSKNGGTESSEKNNHGSWFDAQATDIALALGRTDEAKKILESVSTKRIALQIEPDGSQPLELKRTRSLNYVLFNIEALVLLARMGEHVDIDLWKFATPDGRSLLAAIRVVAPYADAKKPWLKDDLDVADRDRITPLLAAALPHTDDASFRTLLAQFGHKVDGGDHWRFAAGPLP